MTHASHGNTFANNHNTHNNHHGNTGPNTHNNHHGATPQHHHDPKHPDTAHLARGRAGTGASNTAPIASMGGIPEPRSHVGMSGDEKNPHHHHNNNSSIMQRGDTHHHNPQDPLHHEKSPPPYDDKTGHDGLPGYQDRDGGGDGGESGGKRPKTRKGFKGEICVAIIIVLVIFVPAGWFIYEIETSW